MITIPETPTRAEWAALFSAPGNQTFIDPDDFDNTGGYGGGAFIYEAQSVADAIGEMTDYAFSFTYEANSEGELVGYSVSAHIPAEVGLYLTRSNELKHLSADRDAIGADALYAVAENLWSDYQQIVAFAKAKGLNL